MEERETFTREELDELRPDWKVQWRNSEGKLVFRRFKGRSPKQSGAVEFGKDLKRRGFIAVEIISLHRAFPPPERSAIPDRKGLMWCPYCIKWREFEERGLAHAPLLIYMRCTGCSMSIHDAYIRKYNPELVIRYEIEREMKQEKRDNARKKRGKRDVRGAIRRRRRV